MGYSPWGCKEPGTTKQQTLSLSLWRRGPTGVLPEECLRLL